MRWNEIFKESQQLNELFERTAQWRWTHADENYREAKFEVDGTPYTVDLSKAGESGIWGTEFSNRSIWGGDRWGNTGTMGHDSMEVFGTVIAILKDFIKEEKPKGLHFQAYVKDERGKLYTKMLRHQMQSIKELGYHTDIQDLPGHMDFFLVQDA